MIRSLLAAMLLPGLVCVAWADEEHVEQRRSIFGVKRDIMTQGLEQLGIEVYPTTSTFYLWAGVPEGTTDEAYATALLEKGIVISPGSMFGEGNDRFFRLALVPSPAGCKEALERWATL